MRRRRQGGQTLLMITLSLTAMFGLLGLVVDVGYMYYRRQVAHAAAEAAAMAAVEAAMQSVGTGNFSCGSRGVQCYSSPTPCPNPVPSPPTDNVQKGCLYAQSNGFTAGGDRGRQNVTMVSKVSATPDTVPGINVTYWVTTRVTEAVPQLFSAVLGNTWGTISARATAAVVGSAGGGSCIYVMDASAQNAFVASGSANVNAACGISINSNHAKAMVTSGSACVTATSIKITGGYVDGSSCPITPTPTTGVPRVADPLADVVPPSFSPTCTRTNYQLSGGTDTLSPGVYCGGITITGSSTAYLNSGVYILLGGGFTASSSTVRVSGTGVSFYNTADSSHAYKPITISGGTSVTLSAPVQGQPMAGILFFQDRSITSSSKNAVSGTSSAQLTGALYFLTTALVYSGGSSTNTTYVEIVADTVEFSGPSWLADPAAGGGASGGRVAALIE